MQENPKREESEDISSLKHRIESVEKELAQLKLVLRLDLTNSDEKHENILKTRKVPSETEPESEGRSKPPAPDTVEKIRPPVQPPKREVEKTPIDFEKVLFQKVLPAVFLVIFVIGMMFFLKIAVERGWLGEPVRIFLGYATALSLGYFGYQNLTAERRGLGTSLLGGMVATGMLTTFAGHYLYDLLPIAFAFVIGVGFVLSGVYLSHLFKSEILSLMSGVGAFLVTIMLNGVTSNAEIVVVYIIAVFIGMFRFSLKSNHRFTHYVVFVLFQLTMIIQASTMQTVKEQDFLFAALIVHHLFIIHMYLNKHMSFKVSGELFLYTNVLAMTGWTAAISTVTPQMDFLSLALLYIGLAVWMELYRLEKPFAIFSSIAVFTTAVFLLSLEPQWAYAKNLLFLVEGGVGMWLGFRFKGMRKIVLSTFILTVSFMALLSIEMTQVFSDEHFIWLSGLVVMGTVYLGAFRYLPKNFGVSAKALRLSLFGFFLFTFVYLAYLVFGVIPRSLFSDEMFLHVALLAFLSLSVIYLMGYKADFSRYLPYGSLVIIALFSPFVLIMPVSGFLGRTIVAEETWFNIGVETMFFLVLVSITVKSYRETLPFRFWKDEIFKKVLTFLVYVYGFFLVNKFLLATMEQFEVFSDYVYFIHSLFMMGVALFTFTVDKRLEVKALRWFAFALVVITVMKLIFIDLMTVSLVIKAALFLIVGVIGILYSKTFYQKSE